MLFRCPVPDADILELPLPTLALQKAAKLADKPAIVEGPTGRIITFGQLEAFVRRTAIGLVARGLRKGEVVALLAPNLPEYPIAFHGIASAGGVVTPINPLSTPHEIAGQLRDSGARFLICAAPLLDKARAALLEQPVEELYVIGDGADGATPFAALLAQDGPWPDVPISPKDDLVALPYSSGTTGLPKGVMLTHYNVACQYWQCDGIIDVVEDDTVLAVLPFFHIYGSTILMVISLAHGNTIVTMPRFDLEEMLRLIQDHRITRAYLVPPIVLALAKHPIVDAYNLTSLRVVFSGAAPLSAELSREVAHRLNVTVAQGYGMTEASPVTHASPAWDVRPGASGITLRNTEAKIVDVDTLKELGPGERGELWVRGPQVMQGYLKNPEATAATLMPGGWLRTGDIAIFDTDGYVTIVDRLKELIKYKGYGVAPAELEGVLLTHPQVADAAVIGKPDEQAGEIPKAYVVPRAGEEIDSGALLRWVNERVGAYKHIRELELVTSIPKSASGKILRRVLKEQELAVR